MIEWQSLVKAVLVVILSLCKPCRYRVCWQVVIRRRFNRQNFCFHTRNGFLILLILTNVLLVEYKVACEAFLSTFWTILVYSRVYCLVIEVKLRDLSLFGLRDSDRHCVQAAIELFGSAISRCLAFKLRNCGPAAWSDHRCLYGCWHLQRRQRRARHGKV